MTVTKAAVTQSRTPPVVSPVTIDGILDDSSLIRSLEINHSAGKHSYASVKLTTSTKDVSQYMGSTISFRYGVYPRYGYFNGYVHRPGKSQPFKDQVEVGLECLGYTFQMRTSSPRLWRNTSPKQIMQSLLTDHRLGLYYEDPRYLLSRMAQTDESDWQMLIAAATEGSRLVCPWNGGVIRAVDPITELEKGSVHAVYEKSSNTLDPPELSLMDFSAFSEDDSSPQDMVPQFSYFSSDNEVKTVDPAGIPDESKVRKTKSYVNGDSEAQRLSYIANRYASIEDHATARIRGDGTVLPGTVVGISTGTPKFTNTDNMDGRWFVTEVRHQADESLFQTHLAMMRDQYRPVSNARYEPLRGDKRAEPRLSVSNGEWVSSWR